MTDNFDVGVDCAGCDTPLTLENIGGYRSYCKTCVEQLMAEPFPESGSAHPRGKYPNLYWEAA